MALNTWVQGARRRSPVITWNYNGTATPVDLTGATITGIIQRQFGDYTARAITGSLSVTDGENGVFTWLLSAEDVEEAGNFLVQFTATFPTAPNPDISFLTNWRIQSALVVV